MVDKRILPILAGVIIFVLLCIGIVTVTQKSDLNREYTIYDEWICDELATMSETLEYMLVSNGVSGSTAQFVLKDIFQIDELKEIRITLNENGEVLLGVNGARVVTDWISFEHKEDCLVLRLKISYKGKKIIETEYDSTYSVSADKLYIDFFGVKLSFTRAGDTNGE